MAREHPLRVSSLRQTTLKSYQKQRYHPYARQRPSFEMEMPRILAAVESDIEQLAMLKELDDASETGVEVAEVAAEEAPLLSWFRLLSVAIGAAIVWRVVEQVRGWDADD